MGRMSPIFSVSCAEAAPLKASMAAAPAAPRNVRRCMSLLSLFWLFAFDSSADAPFDERGTWHEVHVPLVGERSFQIAVCDARMLAHDRFGSGSLPPLDGGEHAAMLVLGH